MQLLLIGFEAIALVIGSLATAILLCGLLWSLFRWLGHPAWAGLPILALVALACTGHLPASQFLQMVLMFAALGQFRYGSRAGPGGARPGTMGCRTVLPCRRERR